MSEPLRIGHAEFEIHRGNDALLHLVPSGYGRDPFVAATFHGDRQAAVTRALVTRGARDIAPVIWETGEHATEADMTRLAALAGDRRGCLHPYAGIRFDGGNRAVVCQSCDLVLTHLPLGHP